MSIYQTLFDVTIVNCLVTTKINVVDTLYAVTAVSLNIVYHLACVTNQPNVSTAQVITLQWEKEKKILKIKCENNLSLPEARKQYEQFYTGQTYASAVKPGTCNKSTQTDNKSTQTNDSFTEYLKQQTTAKTQGTQEKRNSSPHPGKSNSSHPGPALKQASIDMMKKDEEKKKKEEKDKHKNNKKKKDDSYIKKNKHRKKKNKQKKQNKLKRIHILCLLKKKRRRSWMMILWFSQSHPPVITFQKAHCHDYH